MIILINIYLAIGAIVGTIEMLGEYATGMERGYLCRALIAIILWPAEIPYLVEGIKIGIEENKDKNE